MNTKYPHLFEPLKVRGALFRNRIFDSPEGFYNVGPECFPNAACAAFFERKALGGAASVCLGDCIVDRDTGTHYPFLMRIDDPNSLPGFSALAWAVSRHGAVASVELSHAGMYAETVAARGLPVYGPVEIRGQETATPYAFSGKGGGPDEGYIHEMPEEMIEYLIGKYADAAVFAKQAGFGMVTVHAGHGWLLAQFLSSKINTRKDKWGGSLENRCRFPLAVIDAIHKAAGPAFPVEVRISGTEIAGEGYDLDEGIAIAKMLDEHADILHVSTGHHQILSASMVTHPSMFLPDGVNVKYAAEIKKHVHIPVATVGALTDPAMMEEIIASGQADIVELGRQSIADPDLPIKARSGQEEEIDKCMRCSACFGSGGRTRIFQCAINPVIGHEIEYRNLPQPARKKKVLVAGGGVGGMEAAITAAKRGHQVILCEKTDRLGGILRCEHEVSFKRHLDEYLDRQAMRCEKHPSIEVRLGTAVTPELARSIQPDVIIAAMGARPSVPRIPGIDGKNVMGAEEVYYHPEKAGKNLVILGGGLVGLELALHMQEKGRTVTVVEMQDHLTVDQFSMHTPALMLQLEKQGIGIRLSTAVQEITSRGVRVAGPEGETELSADTVIYAVGQKPLLEEAAALHDCAPEFYQLGDCIAPQNIMNATRTAFAVACDIGRDV